MSVRNQLRLLVGGLGGAQGRREGAPGSGFRDFLDRSRLVAGLIFVVDGGRDRGRQLGRDAGARPSRAAEPDRARAGSSPACRSPT